MTKILGQNVENMTQYNKNMTTFVQSIKDSFTMVEPRTEYGISGVKMVSSPQTTKLTKPAKVPSQTKDLTLETYSKQLQTWTDILEDIPEFVKFQDLMESLKNNKEIKGLPRYIRKHILPVLEKKTYQTMK